MKKKLLSTFVIIIGLFIINSCGSTDSRPQSAFYQVSISASPAEGGTVSPTSGEHEAGTSLDITAKPTEGWRFDHWEGDYQGNSSSATITVEQDMEITGVFVQKEYELTVNIEGEGTVDEKVVQKAKDYKHGAVVELTANPAEGYKFVGWKGAVTGSENPVQVTMAGAKEVTAVFEKKDYTLSITVEGEGTVSEEVVKAKNYAYGTKVKLTATPQSGWTFAGWKGDLTGSENPVMITVNETKTITAVFEHPFAGGDGTAANPYKIATVEQLQKIIYADSVTAYFDDHFIQINDIDATETVDWNRGKGFKPLQLTGSYDGQGYIIFNLTINRKKENNAGLFGYVDGAEISNVKLENVNITGDNSTGGLVGTFIGFGEIYDSYVTGKVHCSGSANGRCGGLVGDNYAMITNSYTDAEVTSTGGTVGGLVGLNWGRIKQSFALGNVTGIREVGGLVGLNNGEDARVTRSYARGEVTGKENIGGLAGASYRNAYITYSYATGKVRTTVGTRYIGGLVGDLRSNISSCYWDKENTGQAEALGGGDTAGATIVGLTTAQMTGTAAKTNMDNFDFVSIWKTAANEYPALFWE